MFIANLEGNMVFPSQFFKDKISCKIKINELPQFTCLGKCCPVTLVKTHEKNGILYRAHFRHKESQSTCLAHNNACESHTHKIAKEIIKNALTYDMFRVKQDCSCCNKCIFNEGKIPPFDNVSCECKDTNKKVYDVACLNDGDVVFIVEIYHTHKTNENVRPMDIPWVELDASTVLNNIQNGVIENKCIRELICQECEYKQILQKEKEERLRKENEERLQKERKERDERLQKERKERDERLQKERKEREEILRKERQERGIYTKSTYISEEERKTLLRERLKKLGVIY